MTRPRTRSAFLAALVVGTAACSSTSKDVSPRTTTSSTAPTVTVESSAPPTDVTATTVNPTTPTVAATTVTVAVPGTTQPVGITPVKPGVVLAADRCAANKAAGKITYLSGFDFAASASIVDVLVAKQKHYFEQMCLDVDVKPSFSVPNYAIVGQNQAQFASGGSFSEVLSYGASTQSDFVVVAEEGKTAIDTLIVKDGLVPTLAAVAGQTIGVKGKIPPSIQAMLAKAGLAEGTDYQTVDIQQQYGFDPTAHIAIPTIIGFPGYKSNEPGILSRAGIKFQTFDPSEAGIPGSFGIIYTNKAFATAHPTAVQDFLRASMKGLDDAVADPAAASKTAFDMVSSNGNPNFLSADGETFRWKTESGLVKKFTPAGQPLGIPDAAGLQAEVDAYAGVGLFGATTPSIDGHIDASTITSIYDASGKVVWP
jgi:ABC-type nitrate/sulfonate/bicarbonate transport system substrate-binding protein